MRDVEGLEVSHALYEAGRAQMAAGNLNEAVAAFRRSIDACPHFKALELLGECHARLGEFTHAIIPLAAATALNRGSRAPALPRRGVRKIGAARSGRQHGACIARTERGQPTRQGSASPSREPGRWPTVSQ